MHRQSNSILWITSDLRLRWHRSLWVGTGRGVASPPVFPSRDSDGAAVEQNAPERSGGRDLRYRPYQATWRRIPNVRSTRAGWWFHWCTTRLCTQPVEPPSS